MSKGLTPEHCLKTGQSIATDDIIGLLEGAGFVMRPANGSSHIPYRHSEYPQFGSVIVRDTTDLGSQREAARLIMRLRAFQKERAINIPLDPRAEWMAALQNDHRSDSEVMTIEDDIVTITSRVYPTLGVSFPVQTDLEQREVFRRRAAYFTQTMEIYAEKYDLEQMREADGTLYIYQPEWRSSLVLYPFAADTYEDPQFALERWGNALQTRKIIEDKNHALDDFANELRARYRGDIVLRNGDGKIVVRDGTAPQIGMVVLAGEKPDTIDARHAIMKNTGFAFTTRLKKLKDTYEVTADSGKRTLYLGHMVYERIAASIRLFSKNGDDDIAFNTLDHIEAQVIERDKHFKQVDAHYTALRNAGKNIRVSEEEGLVVHEFDYQQIGSTHARRVTVADTPQGRRSVAQDAQFYEEMCAIQHRDFTKVIESMGYRTRLLNNGVLQVVHAFYEDLSIEIHDYDRARKSLFLSPLADAFIHGGANARTVDEYVAARNLIASRVLQGIAIAGQALIDRYAQFGPQFNKMEHAILNQFHYVKNVRRIHGRDWEIGYTRPKNTQGLGPQSFAVPIVRITGPQGNFVFIFPEKTLRVMHENLLRQYPRTLPAEPEGQSVRDLFAAALTPSAQQNVKGAVPAMLAPGLGGPQHNAI